MLKITILSENKKQFEYCNIPFYHKQGITGKGIKAAILEREGSTHGQQTANIFWQVAYDSEIVFRPRPSHRVINGRFCDESEEKFKQYYKQLRDEGVNLLVMSLKGTVAEQKELLVEDLILGNGMIFTTSSGNTSRLISGNLASSMAVTFSVGACRLRNGELYKTDYSSYGDEVDVYGFSGLYTTRGQIRDKDKAERGGYYQGTSCANPFFAGQLALLLQVLHNLNYDEMQELVNKYGETVDEWGKLLILPKEVNKLVEEKYPDIKDHWGKDSLIKAIKKGVIKGYPNGKIKPDEAISRAEKAVIMDRLGLLD